MPIADRSIDPTLTARTSQQRLAAIGFWPLQNAGWVMFFLIHWLSGVAHGKSKDYIGMSLSMTISGWLLTWMLHRVFLRIWQRPLWPLVCAVVPWLTLVVIGMSIVNGLAVQRFCNECKPNYWYGYFTYAGFVGYVLISWCGLWFGIKNSRAYHHAQAQTLAAQADAQAAQAHANLAQLKMLRYQLNPHFLFNTLNAITTLTLERDHQTAEQMLSALARFLRYTLDQEPQQKVSLEREMEMLRLYLDIETLRFSDRFAVEIDLPPHLANALIPSLLLQPLVENTVKHAVAKQEQHCVLRIEVSSNHQQLRLYLQDNGLQPCHSDATLHAGVGLRNTQERLQAIYGNAQQFHFGYTTTGQGFFIDITLPLQRA